MSATVVLTEDVRPIVVAELRALGGDEDGHGTGIHLAHRLAPIRGCTVNGAEAFMRRRLLPPERLTIESEWAEALFIACGATIEFHRLLHLPASEAGARLMAEAYLDNQGDPYKTRDVSRLAISLLRFADGLLAGLTDTTPRSRTTSAYQPRRRRTRKPAAVTA